MAGTGSFPERSSGNFRLLVFFEILKIRVQGEGLGLNHQENFCQSGSAEFLVIQ
jgi:hypothetical protein